MMKRIRFDGMEVQVSPALLENEVFDVDFNGHMLVQFTRQEDGAIKPTDAMNGWGENCFNAVYMLELEIEDWDGQ
jgi:hypothetical protein